MKTKIKGLNRDQKIFLSFIETKNELGLSSYLDKSDFDPTFNSEAAIHIALKHVNFEAFKKLIEDDRFIPLNKDIVLHIVIYLAAISCKDYFFYFLLENRAFILSLELDMIEEERSNSEHKDYYSKIIEYRNKYLSSNFKNF